MCPVMSDWSVSESELKTEKRQDGARQNIVLLHQLKVRQKCLEEGEKSECVL